MFLTDKLVNVKSQNTHGMETFWNKADEFFVCLEALSIAERHLSAPLSERDRKDLEHVCLLEQKSDWIQNEFVHDSSVKHPYTSLYPHQQPTTPTPHQTGRQVDGTRRGRMVLEGASG